jgi:hypothetical protein
MGAAALGPSAPSPAAAGRPIPEPHFPNRLYQFVWRNWELANLDRMALVAETRPETLAALGESMGLPPKARLTAGQLRRIYVTAIRQNWHLLPLDQLTKLLGWTREKLEFTLKEDDFLEEKLGPKPACEPVRYAAPAAAEKRRATEIRNLLQTALGAELTAAGEPPFEFVARLSRLEGPPAEPPRKAALDPRYLYSFFALYGDPLMEPEIDPFPEGYLDKLARVGINGVWMQCVLNTMAPSRQFPEFGRGSEERLANLNRLVARAARFGMRIFLYINEPRAMRPEFFARHPEIRGAESRGLYAMCTTPPLVREWISDGLAHIFRQVPGLGGVFSISMSENFTNCYSKFHAESCPRCSKRRSWEVVGELLEAIHRGVRRSSPRAEVIFWDWGWPEEMCRELIPKLPKDSRQLSVSEWSTPIERGGVKTQVGEYSISVVGPGPRATANWNLAKQAGVRYMAKTQFNNTWEISAVPYIPVANLVAEHCARLVRSGISGIQAGWTLGGYPSPNLEVAKEFYSTPAPSAEEVLRRVAARRYGEAAGDLVLRAWAGFSEAFTLYPYSVAIYTIPTQHGPANLLRATPTGVRGSMILFPQDDYKRWAGQYPPEVARREFARMAARWEAALPDFRKAMRMAGAAEDLAIAETCWTHFQSTANQIEFYLLRDGPPSEKAKARMRELARQEMELARRMYPLAKRHSVIAFEASNHYYYRPTDLLEKIVNCQYLLDHVL